MRENGREDRSPTSVSTHLSRFYDEECESDCVGCFGVTEIDHYWSSSSRKSLYPSFPHSFFISQISL